MSKEAAGDVALAFGIGRWGPQLEKWGARAGSPLSGALPVDHGLISHLSSSSFPKSTKCSFVLQSVHFKFHFLNGAEGTCTETLESLIETLMGRWGEGNKIEKQKFKGKAFLPAPLMNHKDTSPGSNLSTVLPENPAHEMSPGLGLLMLASSPSINTSKRPF